MRPKKKNHLAGIAVALTAGSLSARAQDAWPGESLSEAVNLTYVEGPEPNDFWVDLSGACWNATTRTLWVCRNGPLTASKLWALREDGAGGFVVDERGGVRAEWTNFGDLESVTQVDETSDVVFLMIEGEERIKAYDVSVGNGEILVGDWNTRPFLPRNGGAGSEGLTFVPDEALARAGFVDASGAPFTSRNGMGGVLMVGHQNGGGVFAFDCDPAGAAFDFVGQYRTSYSEIAGLEFDRSTGLLFVWHDANDHVLEVIDLRSAPVAGQPYRRFETARLFFGPSDANYEGLAIAPVDDCADGTRGLFLTVDGGGETSLVWFRRFAYGCPDEQCLAGAVNAGPGGGVEDVLFVNGSAGDSGAREVRVTLGDPIEVELRESSAGSHAGRYGLWLWRGPSVNPAPLVFRGRTLGCTANPTPLQPARVPQPFRCVFGAGVPGAEFCGVARELPGFAPARIPWISTDAGGLGAFGTVTIQGVIQDRGALGGPGFSVTNGVMIRVE